MKTKISLFLILAVILVGITPSAVLAKDKESSYIVLKGGYYSTSETYNLDNVEFNTDDGFVAGAAIGHYFLPFLAIELEGGYMETDASTTSTTSPNANSKLKVYPIIATAKLLIPIGPIEPYGEFGAGAYIIDLEVNGTPSNYSGSSEGAFGYHAGAGINIDLGPVVFVGAEGRYLWVEKSYGGEDVKLDGFTVTGNLGFRF